MKLARWTDLPEEQWRALSLTLPELSRPRDGLWSSGQFLREIQGSSHLWIRQKDAEITAVVTARQLDQKIFEIIYLYTAPGWRRQKIMEQLLEEVLEDLPAGAQMWLEVAATNTVAQNLYTKLGFSLQGVRPRYYSDNTDSWLFRHKST